MLDAFGQSALLERMLDSLPEDDLRSTAQVCHALNRFLTHRRPRLLRITGGQEDTVMVDLSSGVTAGRNFLSADVFPTAPNKRLESVARHACTVRAVSGADELLLQLSVKQPQLNGMLVRLADTPWTHVMRGELHLSSGDCFALRVQRPEVHRSAFRFVSLKPLVLVPALSAMHVEGGAGETRVLLGTAGPRNSAETPSAGGGGGGGDGGGVEAGFDADADAEAHAVTAMEQDVPMPAPAAHGLASEPPSTRQPHPRTSLLIAFFQVTDLTSRRVLLPAHHRLWCPPSPHLTTRPCSSQLPDARA